jgi:hypothetical protein
VGAVKLQLALEPPLGVGASRNAVNGPALGQAFTTRPSPEGGSGVAQPSAAFGAPVGPLQEKTV